MKSLHVASQWARTPLASGLCALACCTPVLGELPAPDQFFNLPANDALESVATDLAGIYQSGQMEVVRQRRADGSLYIERETVLDAQANYVNHGQWRMFDQKGKVVAEGRYEMGKRVGPWQRKHDSTTTAAVRGYPFNRFRAPFMSQATFKDGQMDGPWIITDANNRKVMQITFDQGKRHDVAITWAPNGKVVRQVTYDQGLQVGDAVELRNGAKDVQRVATYVDGRRLIEKKDNYPRSKQPKLVETYLSAKTVQKTPDDFWSLTLAQYEQEGEQLRHGLVRHWHSNGQLELEGRYHLGKQTGRFTYWHSNGQKRSEGMYDNDQQQGLWVWWHPNGQKSAIGHYDAGEQTGRWLWWAEDGLLADQKNFDNEQTPVANREVPRLDF